MRAFNLIVCAATVFVLVPDAVGAKPAPRAADLAKKVIPKVAFNGVSLAESLETLGKATGARIEVDWGTLRIAGVTRRSRVKASGEKLTLAKALDLTVASLRGGTEPISWFIHDNTFIITTQANLLSVRIGLARPSRAARSPRRTAPVKRAAAKPLRARRIGKVQFEAARLDGALAFFRDAANVNMVVNWQALAATGVYKHTPVTIKLTNIELTRALDLVLDLVNVDKDQYSSVYWDWDDGVLKITTGTVLDAEMLTRVYAVADLLHVVPNFSAPSIAMHGSRTDTEATGGGGTGLQPDGKDPFSDSPATADPSPAEQKAKLRENLIKAIQASSGLELWADGGGKGTIRILGNKMIVTQSRLGFKLMGGSQRRR